MSAWKIVAKVGVGAVATAALLGASPAFAGDLVSSRGGVKAYSTGAHGKIAVKDTAADSRAAYAEYYRSRVSGKLELRNHSGSGTTVYSGSNTSKPVYKLKGCQAVNFYPDHCAGWAQH